MRWVVFFLWVFMVGARLWVAVVDTAGMHSAWESMAHDLDESDGSDDFRLSGDDQVMEQWAGLRYVFQGVPLKRAPEISGRFLSVTANVLERPPVC